MKIDWRESILKEFAKGVRKLTLVADPDGLLAEERLAAALRARGFDIITFEDSIEFRYVYESRYRGEWDAGRETELVVALRAEADDLGFLPYDILKAGRKLRFSLPEIFPNLSYSVLSHVRRELLDPIYQAQRNVPVASMPGNSEVKTIDFILRHVHDVDVATIVSDKKLLAKLLELHYTGNEPKGNVASRFAEQAKANGAGMNWPLERIVSNRAEFLAWLQDAWECYLKGVGQDNELTVESDAAMDGGRFPSADVLCAKEVRVYLDDYFVDGMLKPVKIAAKLKKDAWQWCGIERTQRDGEDERIEKLFTGLEDAIPAVDASWSVWTGYVKKLGELSSIVFGRGVPEERHGKRFSALRGKLNATLGKWVMTKYGSLAATFSSCPVMVHQIPEYLSAEEAGGNGRIALLVVDGLAMGQWMVMKHEMSRRAPRFIFNDCGVMAWVPTLTAVSRQAIFAGKMPYLFSASINTTAKEKSVWQNFWSEKGYNKSDVLYVKMKGSDSDLETVRQAYIGHSGKCALGIVLNMVDETMHGIQLGMGSFTVQVRQWAQTNFPNNLVENLIDAGFSVYLTADHGNTECVGAGKPASGIADVKGLRARAYVSEIQRNQALESCPWAIKWPAVEMGLPRDYFPLLAADNRAFCKEGETWISHGGISLEELVVPFVKISAKAT